MMDWKDRFVTEATEHRRCIESGDFKPGTMNGLIATLGELRGRADGGQSALTELLDHPNGWVRLGAARHLLPMRAELASTILESLDLVCRAIRNSTQNGSARMGSGGG